MKITELNNDNLKEYIVKYPYCVLKFSAKWCGPCQKLTKDLDKSLANFNNNLVVIINIDYDIHPEIAEEYNITQLPTLVTMEKGVIKDRIIGTNMTNLSLFLNNCT